MIWRSAVQLLPGSARRLSGYRWNRHRHQTSTARFQQGSRIHRRWCHHRTDSARRHIPRCDDAGQCGCPQPYEERVVFRAAQFMQKRVGRVRVPPTKQLTTCCTGQVVRTGPTPKSHIPPNGSTSARGTADLRTIDFANRELIRYSIRNPAHVPRASSAFTTGQLNRQVTPEGG